MPWLTRDAEVLAVIETDGARLAAGAEGVWLVRGPTLVHTLRGNGPLDVAWCHGPGAELDVRRVLALGARRLSRPCGRRGVVLIAPAGAFERWHLCVGDRLEVRGG